jgi:hypothetical protein
VHAAVRSRPRVRHTSRRPRPRRHPTPHRSPAHLKAVQPPGTRARTPAPGQVRSRRRSDAHAMPGNASSSEASTWTPPALVSSSTE